MMTSLRNSPLFRQARSSFVTVIRPLQGGAGYWINLNTDNTLQLFNLHCCRFNSPPATLVLHWLYWFYLEETCCRPVEFTLDFLWLLLTGLEFWNKRDKTAQSYWSLRRLVEKEGRRQRGWGLTAECPSSLRRCWSRGGGQLWKSSSPSVQSRGEVGPVEEAQPFWYSSMSRMEASRAVWSSWSCSFNTSKRKEHSGPEESRRPN